MTKIKTILCLTLLIVFSVTLTHAQKDKYRKLDNYYVLEKYDKCVDEALSMQLDDKYSKDTEPYLYASMGFLGVYRNPDKYDIEKKYPDFKDPLRRSLNNFGKFRKRDKTGEKFEENSSFATELENETFIMMNDLYERNDKSKMGSYAREIAKAFPDDGVMQMVSAAYLAISGNAGDAIKNADLSFKILDSVATKGEVKFTEQETKGLSNAFVLFTDYLADLKGEKQKQNKEKAVKFMDLAARLLPNDTAIKDQTAKLNQ